MHYMRSVDSVSCLLKWHLAACLFWWFGSEFFRNKFSIGICRPRSLSVPGSRQDSTKTMHWSWQNRNTSVDINLLYFGHIGLDRIHQKWLSLRMLQTAFVTGVFHGSLKRERWHGNVFNCLGKERFTIFYRKHVFTYSWLLEQKLLI